MNEVSEHLSANSRSIAAVLVGPLLVDYESQYLKTATKVLFIAGILAVAVFVPMVGVGFLAGEAALAGAIGSPVALTYFYVSKGELPNSD